MDKKIKVLLMYEQVFKAGPREEKRQCLQEDGNVHRRQIGRQILHWLSSTEMSQVHDFFVCGCVLTFQGGDEVKRDPEQRRVVRKIEGKEETNGGGKSKKPRPDGTASEKCDTSKIRTISS